MARVEIDAVVREANGQAAVGKAVTVYERGTTTLATLYAQETGGTTVANPVATDNEGRVNAWVEEGSYDLVVDGVVHAWEAVKGPVVPVGAGFIWFTGTPPSGFLLCDGSQVSQTVYSTLFALLGTQYNVGGESAGMFRLPNLKGRAGIGRDAAQTEFDTLGETGGAKAITLTAAQMPSHTHSDGSLAAASAGDHSHGVSVNAPDNFSGGGVKFGVSRPADGISGNQDAVTTTDGAHTHDVTGATGSAGSGQSHDNLPPYTVVNYIVRY